MVNLVYRSQILYASKQVRLLRWVQQCLQHRSPGEQDVCRRLHLFLSVAKIFMSGLWTTSWKMEDFQTCGKSGHSLIKAKTERKTMSYVSEFSFSHFDFFFLQIKQANVFILLTFRWFCDPVSSMGRAFVSLCFIFKIQKMVSWRKSSIFPTSFPSLLPYFLKKHYYLHFTLNSWLSIIIHSRLSE